jgi:YbbR domain-containing protein
MLRKLFLENLSQKAFALAMALVLFVVVHEDKVVVVTTNVPLQINHPSEMVLTSPRVNALRVSVQGTYGALRQLDLEQMDKWHVTLSGNEEEQHTFDPEAYNIPKGLRIVGIRPAVMLIDFEPKESRRVPVVASVEGEPADGYRLTGVDVEPKEVTVEGAASAVKAISEIQTQTILLAGRTQSSGLAVRLRSPPPNVIYADAPAQFQVSLSIEEKQGTLAITGRPVVVRGGDDGWIFEVSPPTVDVTLFGPQRLLTALDANTLVAYVDASNLDSGRRVLHTRPVQFEPAPGITVTEVKPARVTLARREKPPEPVAEEGEQPDASAPGPRDDGSRQKPAPKRPPVAKPASPDTPEKGTE